MTEPAPDVLAEIAADPSRLEDLPPEDLPDVLAALERIRARVWTRLARPPEAARNGGGGSPPDPGDQMLDAKSVAEILNVDTRYVYDHADDWPFTRRLSPRKLRFSKRGLHRWLERRP